MSDKLQKTKQQAKPDKKYADTQTQTLDLPKERDDEPLPTPPQPQQNNQQQQQETTHPTNRGVLGHDVSVDTSLVCTIPEHHRLEDIIHLNREEIANLKLYLKQIEVNSNNEEIFLLDKRAEFEALDLAINSRKKQLFDLELIKNRKMNGEDSLLSDENSTSFLQVFFC